MATLTNLISNATGNVGIGTTSPAYKLEVASGTSGQQSLVNFRTADSTTANNAGIQIFATPSATATSREAVMALDADGANASGGDYFLIKKRGNSGTTDFEQYSNASMRFGTNFISRATYDMTIANDGNVGIGTTNPSGIFHAANLGTANTTSDNFSAYFSSVNRNASIFLLAKNTEGSAFYFGDGDSNTVGALVYEHTTNYLRVDVNGSERMRINSDGNVGIGTSSPSFPLTVNGKIGGTLYAASYIQFPSSGGDAGNTIIAANDDVKIGYTQTFIVKQSGNVGIGTSGPDSLLHLNKAVTAGSNNFILRLQNPTTVSDARVGILFSDNADTGANADGAFIQVSNNGVDGGGNMFFGKILDTATTTNVTFLSTGNVGIGTTSPSTKLYISGSSSINENLPTTYIRHSFSGTIGYGLSISRNGSDTAALCLGVDSSLNAIISSNNTDLRIGKTQSSTFNEYIRVNTSGNVGIGTTSPGYKLDVNGSARFVNIVYAAKSILSDSSGVNPVLEVYNTVATNATTAIIRQTTAGGNGNQDIGLLVDIQGAGDSDRIANFRYYDGSTYTSRMAITRGGNVGIGTITPSARLHIRGGNELLNTSGSTSGTTSGSLMILGQNTRGGSTYHDFLYVRNTKSGNLNPQKAFRLNNSGSVEIVNNAYSTVIFSLTDAGVLSTTGGGTSDIRTKQNVEYIYQDVSTTINKLKPVKFEFKDNPNVIRHGFIAQDVLNVKPELVLGDGDKPNGTYGLDYDGILALTVKSLQEANKKIEKLEKEIELLKNRL